MKIDVVSPPHVKTHQVGEKEHISIASLSEIPEELLPTVELLHSGAAFEMGWSEPEYMSVSARPYQRVINGYHPKKRWGHLALSGAMYGPRTLFVGETECYGATVDETVMKAFSDEEHGVKKEIYVPRTHYPARYHSEPAELAGVREFDAMALVAGFHGRSDYSKPEGLYAKTYRRADDFSSPWTKGKGNGWKVYRAIFLASGILPEQEA